MATNTLLFLSLCISLEVGFILLLNSYSFYSLCSKNCFRVWFSFIEHSTKICSNNLYQYLKWMISYGKSLFMINILIFNDLITSFYLFIQLSVRQWLKNASTSKHNNQKKTCYILNCRHMPILMKHKRHNKEFKIRPYSKFILFDNSLRNAYR